MKKEIKLLILFLILIILIIVCNRILKFNSITYELNINGNKISVKEEFKDNYYIEIRSKDNTYPFRVYENLNNKRKIVKDIYLYKDDSVECILPIINNSLYTDIMCFKDGILYDYSNIRGQNNSLDSYVDSLNIYNINDFSNTILSTKSIKTITYNIFSNFKKNVVMSTYDGLVINDEYIKLFDKDVYNNKLSVFLNGYYIVADYMNDFTFNEFYIINISNKQVNKIKSRNDISYDSYIEGIVDNKVYLYDKDNENQYEIDIDNNEINIVSSDKYIKYYSNNKWEKMNKAKANKEIYFDYSTRDNYFTKYDYVKQSSDYYYLFKQDGISYKLYRVDKNNIDVYKYILDIPTTNINVVNNDLYYIYKNKLYYYSDMVGLKILLENSELEFNDTIKYYIY